MEQIETKKGMVINYRNGKIAYNSTDQLYEEKYEKFVWLYVIIV